MSSPHSLMLRFLVKTSSKCIILKRGNLKEQEACVRSPVIHIFSFGNTKSINLIKTDIIIINKTINIVLGKICF